MDRKYKVTGISVLVGAAMLVTTAVTGMANTSGYDTYKTAVKNMANVKSMTTSYTVSVKDNGAAVLDVSAAMKTDKNSKTLSQAATITSGGQSKTTERYMQDGKLVTKDSTSATYTVSQGGMQVMQGPGMRGNAPKNEERISDVEKVVDAATTSIQDYISMSSGDSDTRSITMKLSDTQVPALVNAVASIAVKNRGNEYGHGGTDMSMPMGKDFMDKLPKLVDNIKVSSIDASAKVNKDNNIESQGAVVTITGNDASGAEHVITITVNENISNINSTTPDKVDLAGKQVKTIEPKAIGRGDMGKRDLKKQN